MTESQIQDKIRLELGRDPQLVMWRNNIGVAETRGHKIRFGVGGPGGADLIGLYAGRFVAIEVKTPIGKQTEDQKRFEKLVHDKGGIYVVLRSADAAAAWLSEMQRAA